MNKLLPFLLIVPLLISCSTQKPLPSKRDSRPIKDTNSLDILMSQFANNVEMIWGLKEVLIAGPKDYVKYTDHYHTRSHINFDLGNITIETIDANEPKAQLNNAIIHTLLMGDDPTSIRLYSSTTENQISTEPFLYGQVLDETGQPIRWQWRAQHFADYLLAHHLQQRSNNGKTIWFVKIQLVPNHVDKRAHRYLPLIRSAARKYRVDQSLILAIMQTESSFNPYAISRSNALGLMQIIQGTAGRDVFQQQGKKGQPSRSYLFEPGNNIDMGTAYLALLQYDYLAGITNPISRHYAVIASYNGGAGGLLRVFSQDKAKALKIINRMSPSEFHAIILAKHPSMESRNYLRKVLQAQRSFRHY